LGDPILFPHREKPEVFTISRSLAQGDDIRHPTGHEAMYKTQFLPARPETWIVERPAESLTLNRRHCLGIATQLFATESLHLLLPTRSQQISQFHDHIAGGGEGDRVQAEWSKVVPFAQVRRRLEKRSKGFFRGKRRRGAHPPNGILKTN